MMVDEPTMRRLAFIKRLYASAIAQAEDPEPWCARAILTLHDSIELFLHLVCQRRGIIKTKKDFGFPAYWDVLGKATPPVEITQKEGMARLNKARVDLKHHGRFPSKIDMGGYKADATHFFEENTPRIFDIEFGQVSLALLVACAEARAQLQAADGLMKEGNTKAAMVGIATAFAALVDDFAHRQSGFVVSPFFLGESLREIDEFGRAAFAKRDRDTAKFVQKLFEILHGLKDALQILTIGLDYHGYCRFRMMASGLLRTIEGKYELDPGRALALKAEDCQFCYDFVVDVALRTQGFLRLDAFDGEASAQPPEEAGSE